jgi:carbon monoxide dehydrogenase subunit G
VNFHNEFVLDIPADDLFAVLADIQRIAPCMPGAHVDGREGDTYRGSMRVKVGPIVAEYQGTFAFVEIDASTRRGVISAQADESGGQGGAEATIRAAVTEEPAGSRVTIETEVQVRGRVAQLGRGPMERIAKRMIADFAKNLENSLQQGDQPAPVESAGAPGAKSPAVPVSGSATAPGAAAAPATAGQNAPPALDGLKLIGDLVPDVIRKDAVALFLAFACGYLLSKVRQQRR